jgi:hypothetical protein
MGRKRLKERETDPRKREKVQSPILLGVTTMNTLTLIKKQIEKAARLHDAQLMHTTYRGVTYKCKQEGEEVHGTFCYRGRTYSK